MHSISLGSVVVNGREVLRPVGHGLLRVTIAPGALSCYTLSR
jgi:hypothetical protein